MPDFERVSEPMPNPPTPLWGLWSKSGAWLQTFDRLHSSAEEAQRYIDEFGLDAVPVQLVPSDVEKEADESLSCSDCGIPYSTLGLDLVLPDQQWKVIAPEGGILCANCICRRAAKNIGTVVMAWIDRLDYSAIEKGGA